MRAMHGVKEETMCKLQDNPPEEVHLDSKEAQEAFQVDQLENILLAMELVTNKGMRYSQLFPEGAF
jgi:hypothetical protein